MTVSKMQKQTRPRNLKGITTKYLTGCGDIYITVNKLEGQLFEVITSLGKAGGCAKCVTEAITRSITTGLRYNIPPEEYIKQLKGLSCPGKQGVAISCPEAIAKALEENLEKVTSTPSKTV